MSLPVLLTADADAELTNTIAIWEGFANKALIPGQPDYLLASILAYNKYLMLQRCNAAFVNMLLDYATAPVLDYIVALLGVQRTPAQPATCTLEFTLVHGHGTLTISAGTRVSSSDGIAVFEVDEDTLVASDVDTIQANATCQTEGIIGNGYAIGAISTIMDVQPYLSACQNIDITASGAEVETDEELRSRSKLAPSTFSVAGARDAYIFFTKKVSPLICDVSVVTSTDDLSVGPGEVDIYPLLDGGQAPSDSLVAQIQSALSSETIRPLTDTVIVYKPTAVSYDVTVDVTKLSSYSEPSSTITDKIDAILGQYKISKYSKLGQDIIASEIESLCRVEGIYDLAITITAYPGWSLTGRNLVLSPNEYGVLQVADVNVIGENNG